jgi:lysophospholipase
LHDLEKSGAPGAVVLGHRGAGQLEPAGGALELRRGAGTIAILPGRAEFIEKYFEVIGELLSRNFDVAILDWRGQGLSGRLANDPRKGHIGDFGTMSAISTPWWNRSRTVLPAPVVRLAIPMGATIALAQARAGRSPFARMVLTAPMIDIYGLRFQRGKRILAKAFVLLRAGPPFRPRRRPKTLHVGELRGQCVDVR